LDSSRAVHQSEMPALLGEWRNGAGPLAQRLADAVEHAVERGELLEGWALPSERTLAAVLDISRSTMLRGMELLAKRGVVRRVHGSGTFVAGRSGQAAGAATRAVRSAPETAPSAPRLSCARHTRRGRRWP
jgi:DNA-binding GntR family transcriptional regulator